MIHRVFFDVTTGVSGDMVVAALLDAGAPENTVVEAMATAASFLDEMSVSVERMTAGARVSLERVASDNGGRKHRRATSLIAALNEAMKTLAIRDDFPMKVLMTLINGECAIHDCRLETVHLHELGSADTIATIIGAYVAADFLGLFGAEVLATPIATGYGTITVSHGTLSVPAPVTAHILRNYKTIRGAVEGEVTTPTGAAILTNLIQRQTENIELDEAKAIKIGRGIGSKTFSKPSVFRVLFSDF